MLHSFMYDLAIDAVVTLPILLALIVYMFRASSH